MKLVLMNGYPFPFPEGFDTEKEGYDCRDFNLEIEGVMHFEWLHTVTVEFEECEDYDKAKALTSWERWSDCVLEAKTSRDDGYNHPAIIVHDKAYCGFILVEDVA
jgi:hypothetical protein